MKKLDQELKNYSELNKRRAALNEAQDESALPPPELDRQWEELANDYQNAGYVSLAAYCRTKASRNRRRRCVVIG